MNRPYVLLNVAATADGKIDTIAREGATISSAEDKERVDRLRAEVDAVLVGGKTLLGEDPKLTVKSEDLRAARVARGLTPNPIKVGIATRATLTPDSRFVSEGPAQAVIFTTDRSSKREINALRAAGVDVHVQKGTRVDLPIAMDELYTLGVRKLLLEGGGTLNAELLQLGLVDQIQIYVAPVVFAGGTAPTLADGPGLPTDRSIKLKLRDFGRLGPGVLLDYEVLHEAAHDKNPI